MRKVPTKKKESPKLRELCSAVSALFMHCKSLTRGKDPRKKKSKRIRSSPEESDFALAKEK
jgi:hypothetical protein